jgi:hypothetical protein
MLPSTLPFGKYQGTPLDEVPRNYLFWTLLHYKELDPDLRVKIIETLDGERARDKPRDPQLTFGWD